MDIKSYNDALTSQQALLSDYIASHVSGITVPTSKSQLQVSKSNFLTKSGWVYNIIGILAFIIGLIVGISGIWLTGCAGILAGCYCWIKGKQQLKQEAYDNLGNSILKNIDEVIAYVSKTWGGFIGRQNVNLRKDIVNSNYDSDKKVAALGYVNDNSYLHVDLKPVEADLEKLDDDEALKEYSEYLPTAQKHLTDSLGLAAKAQADAYSLVEEMTTGYKEQVAPGVEKAAPAAPEEKNSAPATAIETPTDQKTAPAAPES